MSNPAKRWSTAQAKLTLRKGYIVTKIDGDRGEPLYVVTLGAWTKCFDSIDELEQFVGRVEGVPA